MNTENRAAGDWDHLVDLAEHLRAVIAETGSTDWWTFTVQVRRDGDKVWLARESLIPADEYRDRRDDEDWKRWKLRALRDEAVLKALKQIIYDRPEGQTYEDDGERFICAEDLVLTLDDTRIDCDLWLDADGNPTRDFDQAVTGAEHLVKVDGGGIVNTQHRGFGVTNGL